jgi:hypothetical protein
MHLDPGIGYGEKGVVLNLSFKGYGRATTQRKKTQQGYKSPFFHFLPPSISANSHPETRWKFMYYIRSSRILPQRIVPALERADELEPVPVHVILIDESAQTEVLVQLVIRAQPDSFCPSLESTDESLPRF